MTEPSLRDASRAPTSWRESTLWFAVGLFVAHLAILLLVSSWGQRMYPVPLTEHPYEVLEPLSLRGLCRWDCGLYYNLASHGYTSDAEAKVFPLYPLITWAFSRLTGLSTQVSLIAVANLAYLAALLVIFRIYERLAGVDAARWGLLLFCAFPFAYFHAAGYAESLFLLFTAGSILLALDERHIAAGAVLALGCATRHVSLLGVTSLAAIAVIQRGWHPKRLVLHRGVVGLALPLAGIAAFMAYCQYRFHDPVAFSTQRTRLEVGNQFWSQRAWWSVIEAFRGGRTRTEPLLSTYVFWSLLPATGTVALFTRRAWWPLAPFAAALMTLFMGTGIMGLGRFTASCWPAFLPLGVWIARRPLAAQALLIPLALAQGAYFFLWSHWFGIW